MVVQTSLRTILIAMKRGSALPTDLARLFGLFFISQRLTSLFFLVFVFIVTYEYQKKNIDKD